MKGKEFQALAALVATLSKNVNDMLVHIGSRLAEDDNENPTAVEKLDSNAKNQTFIMTTTKEKECQSD